MNWQPLRAPFKSIVPGHPDAVQLPAKLGTPPEAWAYGAFTDLIEIDKDATLRIQARSLSGKIGLCLITEDYSSLASAQHLITPADGEKSVTIAYPAAKAPARLLVRNSGDPGNRGEVEISGIDIAYG